MRFLSPSCSLSFHPQTAEEGTGGTGPLSPFPSNTPSVVNEPPLPKSPATARQDPPPFVDKHGRPPSLFTPSVPLGTPVPWTPKALGFLPPFRPCSPCYFGRVFFCQPPWSFRALGGPGPGSHPPSASPPGFPLPCSALAPAWAALLLHEGDSLRGGFQGPLSFSQLPNTCREKGLGSVCFPEKPLLTPP